MPDKRAIILPPDARRELDAIYDPLFSAILKRLDLLAVYPHLGIELTDRLVGWRSTVVGLFKIIYRVTPDAIEVAYIRHCKRQMPEE